MKRPQLAQGKWNESLLQKKKTDRRRNNESTTSNIKLYRKNNRFTWTRIKTKKKDKIENANGKAVVWSFIEKLKRKEFYGNAEWNRARFTLIAFSLVILVELLMSSFSSECITGKLKIMT